MKTFMAIVKGIFRVLGAIIKFSVLLVVAIIATIIIIANFDGCIEGISLLITWILFTVANMGKKTSKRVKETE